MKKSVLPQNEALEEFLIQYRRTSLASGLSPSKLLNGRQIRAKIDILLPSPAHTTQRNQMKIQSRSRRSVASEVGTIYQVGTPCYALWYSANNNRLRYGADKDVAPAIIFDESRDNTSEIDAKAPDKSASDSNESGESIPYTSDE